MEDQIIDIDKWLESLPPDKILEVWKVVQALEEDSKLIGSKFLVVPPQFAEKTGLAKHTVEVILTKLYQLHVIQAELAYDSVRKIDSDVISVEWDDWPPEDDVVLSIKTGISIGTKNYKYLYSKIRELLQDGDEVGYRLKWQAENERSLGYLILPNGEELKFRASNFGGINEFFKNIQHITTRDRLRRGIAKHKQGGSTSPGLITVSKWKSWLKKSNPHFFKYFDIEPIRPDSYRLVVKGF